MVWARRSGICLNEFRVANFRFQIQRGCHVSIVDRTAFHASVGFLTTDVTDHTDESWRGLRPQPNLAALARTRPPPNNALSGEFGYRRSRTLPAFWPSDLASQEPRSGNQNAKQKRTLAPAGFMPVVPCLAAATRSCLRRWSLFAVHRAATTSKPSVHWREASGAVLAGGWFHSGC